MRIRITDGKPSGEYLDLMVDSFSHNLRRMPSQIALASRMLDQVVTPMVFLADFGQCGEEIILEGKTDEVNGPTRDEITVAIMTWGFYDMYPGEEIRLYEAEDIYYTGTFNRCSFDHVAGEFDSRKFQIRFLIKEKFGPS